jgi:tetratricopeptide (TPR) repeat protein
LDGGGARRYPLWFAYPREAVAARAPVSVALGALARALASGSWPRELGPRRGALTFTIGHFVGLTRADVRLALPYLALPYYAAAARLDPGYRRRSHFWAGIGALLFDARRYRWAERAYARAIALNPSDADLLGRRADALVHSHDFDAASAAYEAYLARRDSDWEAITASAPDGPGAAGGTRLLPDMARYSGWYLKAITLPHIVALSAALGAASLAPAEDKCGEETRSAVTDDEARGQLAAANAAFARDPLDACARFNRGVAAAHLEQSGDAWVAFTVAACYAPGDVEAWANAAILAMTPERETLLPPIVWAAHAFHGDVILRTLDHIVGRNDADARALAQRQISAIVSAGAGRPEPHEVRVLLPDGGVGTLALEPEPGG